MRRSALLSRLLLACLLQLLVSCGGGSSTAGGVGSGGTGASVGVVQVAVTDAPSQQFDHVWVTLSAIRFNPSASAGPDDAGWLSYPLATPVPVDLAALSNGALETVFNQLNLPAGSYQQVLLVLAGDADPLTAPAALQGLVYNDQVDYTDATGSHIVALNIANPAQGISVAGNFKVVAGQTLRLTFDFDVGNDVVQYELDGATAFTLKPKLGYFDMAHVGAVEGHIDMSSVTAAGAYDLVIKAEQPNAAGTLQQVVRATGVSADGSFVLYPVAIPQGQGTTSIDIMVRGRNMASMIIQGVPVTLGTTPQSPTQLTQTPIAVTASSEYSANLNSPLSPSGAAVELYQTLPGAGELPHEEIFRYTNPYTGTFIAPLFLPTAPLQVASYQQGADSQFTGTTPAEGAGAFQAFAEAPGFATGTVKVVPPASGSAPVGVAFGPSLPQASGVNTDSISGSIGQVAGTYNAGYLVLTMGGQIATTYDLSGTLAQNAGAGGRYTVSGLAGGSAGKALPGAIYYGSVTVWNSASPQATLVVEHVAGSADLRQGNAAGFDVTLK